MAKAILSGYVFRYGRSVYERQSGLRRHVCRSLLRTRPGGASGFVLLAGVDETEGFVAQSKKPRPVA